MSTPTKPLRPSSTRASRTFGKLHRLTGLTVALPVILLVVTGIPLQFTQQLGLGTAPVDSTWVHNRYNLEAPEKSLTSAGVTQLGDQLFAGDRVIQSNQRLIGALAREVITIVMLEQTIILVPVEPDVPVESIPLPAQAKALGEDSELNLIADTPDGLLASEDLGASWYPARIDSYQWVTAASKPVSDADKTRYRSHQISWERLLQDAHSGRLFGAVGEWVMNLAGIALILLAFTGAYVWIRGRAKA
jgi:hypothetical protein